MLSAYGWSLRQGQAVPVFAMLVVIIAAGTYIFWGENRAVIVIAGVVVAGTLYCLRKSTRLLYGAIEVLIGFVGMCHASGEGRGAFSSGIDAGFSRVEWTVVLLVTATSIYVMIRGIDNIKHSLAKREQ